MFKNSLTAACVNLIIVTTVPAFLQTLQADNISLLADNI